MKRRDFIATVVGTAIAGPVVVGAQQSAIPVIGFLDSRSTETRIGSVDPNIQGCPEVMAA
jgi:hypothetical protein